ncbi:MAG: SOS response-associated peptidase [Bacillota bacterium]|jgi:putative SOS response-associated peptidase YedK
MCGRYAVFDEEDNLVIRKIIQEIDEKFAGTPEREEMQTGEIFPTNIAPVLLPTAQGGIRAVPLKWGFPRFNNPGVVINVRQETVGTKNMFRSSFATRRCVIPASGFFEWKETGTPTKKKDKYLLRLPHVSVMYMAGLYNVFTDSKTGRRYGAFVILTTQANHYMEKIHDRMPVILSQENLSIWLFNHQEAGTLLGEEGPLLVAGLVA